MSAVVAIKRRKKVRCLGFKARPEVLLIHEHFVIIILWIVIFAKLPVEPPSAVRTVYQVYKPLMFACMIAIIVDGNQVAIFIEHKFVRIS